MKLTKKVAALGALAALAAPLAGAGPAQAASLKLAVGGASSTIVGNVAIGAGGTTATVTGTYVCPNGSDWHLWVSVKQAVDLRPDNALKVDGSGWDHKAAAFLQGHPQSGITCDGAWHTSSFTVPAMYGTLEPGQVYAQFCLVDPNEENPAWAAFDMRFSVAR
jgi:hypothetical protein